MMVTMMYVAQFSIRYQFHPLEGSFVGCFHLRQMVTCALLSLSVSPHKNIMPALLTQRFVGALLDVDLNTFQLLKPSNGNMKSIPKKRKMLKEEISVSIDPFVSLCGTVSCSMVPSY
jgi:hypothetical protein